MYGLYAKLAFTAVLAVISFWFGYYLVRKTRLRGGCLLWTVIFLTPLWVLFLFILSPFGYLEPYEGKVVDNRTSEPISEAVVLVIYRSQAPSVAGTIGGNVYVRETLTDENGEFRFPTIWRIRPLGGGSPYGQIFVWKPGYTWGLVEYPNFTNTFWLSNEEHRTDPPPYEAYGLNKLQSMVDREKYLPSPIYIGDIELPIYHCLINQERIQLHLQPYRVFNCD